MPVIHNIENVDLTSVTVQYGYSTWGNRLHKYIYNEMPLCIQINNVVLVGRNESNDSTCSYFCDAVATNDPGITDFKNALLKRFDHSVTINDFHFKLASNFLPSDGILFLEDMFSSPVSLVCSPSVEGPNLIFNIVKSWYSNSNVGTTLEAITSTIDTKYNVTGSDYMGSTFVTNVHTNSDTIQQQTGGNNISPFAKEPYFTKLVTFTEYTEGIFANVSDKGIYLVSLKPNNTTCNDGARLTCVYSNTEDIPKITEKIVLAGPMGEILDIQAAPDGVFIKWNAQHSATYNVTVTCLDDICVNTKSKTASIKSTYNDSRCNIM